MRLESAQIHCHVLPLTGYYYSDFTHQNYTKICLFSVKFLEVIKPFCAVLPEIQKPERKVSRLLLMHLEVTLKKNHCHCEAFPFKSLRYYPTDSVQRKGIMDSHHPFYLSGLLSGKCPDLFIDVLFNLIKTAGSTAVFLLAVDFRYK